MANEALENDKQMISSIADRLGKAEKGSVRQAEHELKKSQKRLAEPDKLFAKLYEEHVNGKVNERNYNSIYTTYEAEQNELETKNDGLEEVIKSNCENGENAENFVDLIKQYADIDELTQALLNTLIDRIEVHEPEKVEGEYIQKIDVYYNSWAKSISLILMIMIAKNGFMKRSVVSSVKLSSMRTISAWTGRGGTGILNSSVTGKEICGNDPIPEAASRKYSILFFKT